MKVGVILPMFSGDPARVMAFAHRAEELGYDGVFAFDHFFPPGAAPDRPSLEPFAILAAVGAATERITVGTLVTRAGLRSPGLVAKMAASIDGMTSGGRMILGIGTGDPIDEPEHRAFGFPSLGVKERRAHLIETVRAVKALFAGEAWEGGELVAPLTGPLLPPPATPGGPPVWVAGQADQVVRIAAQVGDAWNGWGMHVPEFARKADLLAESARALGRNVEPTWAGIVVVGRDEDEAGAMLEARYEKGMLESNVWAGGVRTLGAFLRALGEAGASWAVLVPAGPADRVEMIADVLPSVSAASAGDPGLRERKAELRARVRVLRDAISPEDRARLTESICERLMGIPEVAAARSVMLFSAFGSEVGTEDLIVRLASEGRRLALPRILGGNLIAAAYQPGDPLVRARFGAMEPEFVRPISPREIDLVIAPGLAFDRCGNRVGYGAGFFDRFLPATRPDAVRVGICFAVQIVDEVPAGPDDYPLDLLVTESEVIDCRVARTASPTQA